MSTSSIDPRSRPFRFGVQVAAPYDAKGWVELARQVEVLGYATFTMPDHFHQQLAPIPALMAAASATERLRVGALVLDNDYRHPVVLAKEFGNDGRAVRRPSRHRPRGRVDGQRLRGGGYPPTTVRAYASTASRKDSPPSRA